MSEDEDYDDRGIFKHGPLGRPMCRWSPYCYGDTKLFADKVRLENALKEAKNRFESILVLATEGPDAWQNRIQLFQAIEQQAKLGYDALDNLHPMGLYKCNQYDADHKPGTPPRPPVKGEK